MAGLTQKRKVVKTPFQDLWAAAIPFVYFRQRHTRAQVRHERQRRIARRAVFWRWCFGEWTPRVAGRFAKSNGSCNCWQCAKPYKYHWQRRTDKLATERLVDEYLAS